MNKKFIAVIVAVIVSVSSAVLYYYFTNKEAEIPTRGTFVQIINSETKNNYNISIGDNDGKYLYKTA